MPSGRLGLRGGIHPHRGLVVKEVKAGGFLEKWNDGCARTFFRDVVRVGDEIVQANDCDSPPEMLQSLNPGENSQLDGLQLCVLRRGDFGGADGAL